MIATDEDFERQTVPFRREILAHCYQLLGSVHDAEDLAQETMLRAWRARGQFDERRASLRTWPRRGSGERAPRPGRPRRGRPVHSGRDANAAIIARVIDMRSAGWRLRPSAANGQRTVAFGLPAGLPA